MHSTGHASRLARKKIVEFDRYGSEQYGIEELTAEIGASYLNSVSGIIDAEFDKSVSYITAWLDRLRRDKRLVFYASGQAQRAVDFILNANIIQETYETKLDHAETQ